MQEQINARTNNQSINMENFNYKVAKYTTNNQIQYLQ